MHRRSFLQLMSVAALAASPLLHAQPQARRVAPLDWQLAEIMLGLGVSPLAIPSLDMYRARVPQPPLPAGVLDLGASWEPSLELLARLKPDLILLSPVQQMAQAQYAAIAPVRVLDVPTTLAPIPRGLAAISEVGEWLHCQPEAQALVASLGARLDAARTRILGQQHRPIYLADIDQGGSHVRLWGHNSLLGDALARVGLVNAWDGELGPAGFALVPLEQLVERPEARMLYLNFGKASQRSLKTLSASTLWNVLPFVREGRLSAIPPTYVFGGTQTAARFAELLVEHLPADPEYAHG